MHILTNITITLLLLLTKKQKSKGMILMDNFIEQIVVKKTETRDIIKRLGFFAGGLSLCFTILTLGLMTGLLMIFLFLAFGVIWGAWYFIQSTFIEYEYIVTNNELDIDKIMARKKRKRLITIRIDKTEEWGEYAEGKGKGIGVTVEAHDCGYKNLWYIVSNHDKHGKLVVFFSPNKAVLEAVNKSVPYALRKKELKEKIENETDEIIQNMENKD